MGKVLDGERGRKKSEESLSSPKFRFFIKETSTQLSAQSQGTSSSHRGAEVS